MTLLLFMLVFFISLLVVVSVFADHLSAFAQQYLPIHGEDSEQLILLSGMLLAAFVIGLLVMYLLLRI